MSLNFDNLGDYISGDLHLKYKYNIKDTNIYPGQEETQVDLRIVSENVEHRLYIFCKSKSYRDDLVNIINLTKKNYLNNIDFIDI